jgi:hypothetical protein
MHKDLSPGPSLQSDYRLAERFSQETEQNPDIITRSRQGGDSIRDYDLIIRFEPAPVLEGAARCHPSNFPP